MNDCTGLLFIGDPHVASRPPGFRKDDYPEAILQKLQWALDYAREHRLGPCCWAIYSTSRATTPTG